MKAEKGSEIITTICEYENSVAMPDNERLTYLDTCGIARLKDGNGNVKAQEAYANRCSEYLREAEPAAEAPAGTRWVPRNATDYGFDDNDDDIPAFSFPEA